MKEQRRLRMTRREFLARSAGLVALAGSGAWLLDGCTAPPAAPTSGPAATAAPTSGSAATSAPAATKAPAAGVPKVGGSTVWAQELSPHGLNPHTTTDNPTMREHVYEGLTQFDQDLNVIPALAESWEATNDTTYVFHLRQGVKWHDGTDFTADDVKYTFDWILDTSHPVYWRTNYDGVAKIEVVDKNTVKFTCKYPFPPLPAAMATMRNSVIVQKGYLEKSISDSQMMGTGAYRQVEYVEGSHCKLVRNEAYWGKPVPYMQEVVLKVLPDEDSRIAALRNGSVDYALLSPEGEQRLKDTKGLVFMHTPTIGIRVVKFNMLRKPWSDVRVRQAVNFGIDRKEIIDKVFSGFARVSGPLPTGMGNYFVPPDELNSKYYKYDPEKAKQLLKDANYPTDQAVDLIYTPSSPTRTALVTVIAEQMRRIGVNVKIRQLETGQFTKEENPPVNSYDWSFGSFSPRHDPDGYLWQRFYSDSGKNEFAVGYRNDALDALLLKGRSTFEPAKRKEIYDQAQAILLNDVPNVWLLVEDRIQGISSRVQGFAGSQFERLAWTLNHAWLADA